MITVVPDFVAGDELRQLQEGLAAAGFADGALSAGWHARGVKKNLQLTRTMPGHEPLARIVMAAFERSALLQMAARPRHFTPVLFNRYEPGMTYGAHVDDAIMTVPAPPGRIRTDVAFTLFVSDPATYGGGELIFSLGGGEQTCKLPAGGLVAYPAATLHRVAPVTEGVRLAAVGWIQSELRDPAQRAVLFDLDVARRGVFAASGKNATFDLLSKVHGNLLQMWAEL